MTTCRLKAVLQLLAVVCPGDRHFSKVNDGHPHVVLYNVVIGPKNGYFTISNGIFKFNFLALVVSEIIGGVANLH